MIKPRHYDQSIYATWQDRTYLNEIDKWIVCSYTEEDIVVYIVIDGSVNWFVTQIFAVFKRFNKRKERCYNWHNRCHL